jgi:hypothetical protein
MTITINFENQLWFLIFALAQKECIQFYQGVEKACLAIVLSVLLRYTDSDYPFGIFKFSLLFLIKIWNVSLKNSVQVAFLCKNLKRELISLIMVLAVHLPDKFWSIPVPEYLILLCSFILLCH